MSETSPGPQTMAGQPLPPLVMNVQYVKDLSFEVPGAPQIFATLRSQPNVGINLDVQARRIDDNASTFEVTLAIRAEAKETTAANGGEPAMLFIAELSYCGIVTLSGIPDNATEPALLVEVPRLLFPYARNILADVTRDGGFPPVLLQPIDFVALWQSRRAAPVGNA